MELTPELKKRLAEANEKRRKIDVTDITGGCFSSKRWVLPSETYDGGVCYDDIESTYTLPEECIPFRECPPGRLHDPTCIPWPCVKRIVVDGITFPKDPTPLE